MKLWYKKAAWSNKGARKILRNLGPESIQSIAVVRHAALGDMIHTRPFLIELKRAFPNAKITISIVSNYSRGVPEDLVDRVHVVHRKSAKKQSMLAQFRNIRQLGYHDLIIDLCDTPRSRAIVALNPAQIKMGFSTRWLIKKLVFDVCVPRSDLVFEADMMLQLLNILGVKTSSPPQYGFDNYKKDKRRERYIIYFPSASIASRYWDQERVVELVQKISTHYPDYKHYILKGRGDEEKTDCLLKKLSAINGVQAVEINELKETLSFIAKADLVVSNDTSIRHLAIATGTSSVGIYFGKDLGSTPFRYWPRWGQHEAAFEGNGEQPSAQNVFECCARLIDKTYDSGKR